MVEAPPAGGAFHAHMSDMKSLQDHIQDYLKLALFSHFCKTLDQKLIVGIVASGLDHDRGSSRERMRSIGSNYHNSRVRTSIME